MATPGWKVLAIWAGIQILAGVRRAEAVSSRAKLTGRPLSFYGFFLKSSSSFLRASAARSADLFKTR